MRPVRRCAISILSAQPWRRRRLPPFSTCRGRRCSCWSRSCCTSGSASWRFVALDPPRERSPALNQRRPRRRWRSRRRRWRRRTTRQQAAATHGTTMKGLGMTGAMVERQLGHRRIALANMVNAQFAGRQADRIEPVLPPVHPVGRRSALGALARDRRRHFGGAIIASSVLLEPSTRSRSRASSAPGRRSPPRGQRSIGCRARSKASGRAARLYGASAPRQAAFRSKKSAFAAATGGRSWSASASARTRARSSASSARADRARRRSARSSSARIQPTVGTVRIDGARLTDWDQDELGKYLGYMPQEPSLFEGTIKENIARFRSGRRQRRGARRSTKRWSRRRRKRESTS